MGLFDKRIEYKPFEYPEYYTEGWLKQSQAHWLHTEISMQKDIKEWFEVLSDVERYIGEMVLLAFTQSEVAIEDYWAFGPTSWFPKPEIIEMARAFSYFECFDNKTELLTSEGWVPCPLITENHKIAQYDIKTKEISFIPPKKVVSYNYSGVLHYYSNNTTDICVTPNHDLIVKNCHTDKIQKRKSFELRLGRNYTYPTSGIGIGLDHKLTSLEQLLIAIAADGSLRGLCPSNKDKQIQFCDFYLTKKRKVSRLIEILNNANIKYSIYDAIDSTSNIVRKHITFNLPSEIDINNIKNLKFLDLESMSKSKALDIINEISYWDGSRKNNKPNCFYSTNKEAVDKIQAVALLAEITAHIGINRDSSNALLSFLPNGKHPKTAKTCYRLSFNYRQDRTYPRRQEIEYTGKVYCVSVDTQNLVSRRNNKVAFTGNTVHASAYSYLNESVNLVDFKKFLREPTMSKRFNLLINTKANYTPEQLKTDPHARQDIARSIAIFSAFGEGVALYSSFAILYSFSLRGLLQGIAQQMKYSIRDEELHSTMGCKLFNHLCYEYPELRDSVKEQVLEAAKLIITLEHNFIDKLFELGDLPNLKSCDLKEFITQRTNLKLQELGYSSDTYFPYDKTKADALSWFYTLSGGVTHTDFFALRPTDYSKSGGEDWNDIY